MRRSLGPLLAFLALASCGPAPPNPKPGHHAALAAEKEPSSSEWLYVTRRMQGTRDAECRAVLETIRGETKCRRALCQPAVRLAKDWGEVCGKRFATDAAEVRALEAKLQAEVRSARHACETEFESLVTSSCAPRSGQDCLDRTRRWATQCGSEYGTPLVLTMISVRAERATGEPVVLDARSCDEFLSELTTGLSCGNLPTCEDRLPIAADYRNRCWPAGGRVPLTQALVVMAVQAAAQHPAEPIPLSEAALAPGVPVLPLVDGQGAILRVGWSHPISLEAYAEAVRAADGSEIQVARVFRSSDGMPELRLGKFTAPEGRTLGDRFASFRVRGEVEGLQSTALALLQQKLGQAVQAQSPRDAAARLLEGLGAFASLPALPEPARAALRASDASLKGVCRWLAEEKNRLLSKVGDRRAVVASMRRSERLPFADVSAAGNVVFGAENLAGLYEAHADMPECSSAYDEGLAYLAGRVRTIKLSKADEATIAGDSDAKTAHCVALSKELAQTEQKLFECSFALRQCSEEGPDALAQDYDRAALVLRRARVEARVAAASLREDPSGERAAKLAECIDGSAH